MSNRIFIYSTGKTASNWFWVTIASMKSTLAASSVVPSCLQTYFWHRSFSPSSYSFSHYLSFSVRHGNSRKRCSSSSFACGRHLWFSSVRKSKPTECSTSINHVGWRSSRRRSMVPFVVNVPAAVAAPEHRHPSGVSAHIMTNRVNWPGQAVDGSDELLYVKVV